MTAPDRVHLLQSEDQLKLLDEIDQLRSQGISRYVNLPQIIVCGDQSSGKSSVLEAISGITFPTKETLCTRFATEVILRKAPKSCVSVSIVPSEDRSEADSNRLREFSEILEGLAQFATLVDKAKNAMGIAATNAFSNDILRVEVSGPERPHLTIVDLPGLVHSETKDQDAAAVSLVWDLVTRYMHEKRSIILAVISANNDYANQIVLKLVQQIDAGGNRTLGVITKPDTLPVGSGSENAFVELARNEDIKLRLGWHVLKNRSFESRNDSTEARNASEKAFFEQGIWRSLSRSMVGVSALQARLSKVLLRQIQAELPSLVKDIETGVEVSQIALRKLGDKRATVDEQKLFLIRIGQSFQALTKAAVDGTYSHEFFGDTETEEDYSKHLRAVIENLNLDYANKMRDQGHSRRIVEEPSRATEDRYGVRMISRADFEAEIITLLRRNRGRELPGMFNPLVVGDVFYQQSRPWESISQEHVQKIYEAVKVFLGLLLSHLTDENTRLHLLRDVIWPLFDKHVERTHDKLGEVLAPHKRGHPITYNHYFTETVQNIRHKRQENDFTQRLQRYSEGPVGKNTSIIALLGKDSKVSDLLGAFTAHNEADMDKYAASEVLLCAEAYYKVAMKVLVDNVATLAIQACLSSHLSELLSPSSIQEMNDGLISAIAAESEENQAERDQLTRKLEVLRSGLDICKRYSGYVGSAILPAVVESEKASAPSSVATSGREDISVRSEVGSASVEASRRAPPSPPPPIGSVPKRSPPPRSIWGAYGTQTPLEEAPEPLPASVPPYESAEPEPEFVSPSAVQDQETPLMFGTAKKNRKRGKYWG